MERLGITPEPEEVERKAILAALEAEEAEEAEQQVASEWAEALLPSRDEEVAEP